MSLAVGPTSGTGLSQSIYYAPNIAGGSNTVTVTFNQAAAYPDMRILEYRGVTDAGCDGGSEREAVRRRAAERRRRPSANELIFGADT